MPCQSEDAVNAAVQRVRMSYRRRSHRASRPTGRIARIFGEVPGGRDTGGTGFVLPGGAVPEHDGQMNRRDYCPIAASVEVLGDRWTPLIIRELMVGAGGFNEIHRGIPRASRTLLAQRLRELERRGLVRHEVSRPGRPGGYGLTAAGQALTPIVWAMGAWAAEWLFGDPSEEHCDGLTLIWRTHQVAIPAKLPETRTVVHLVLTGAGGAQGWLDIQRPGITVCRTTKAWPSISPSRPTLHRCTAGSSGSCPCATSSPTDTPASSDRADWRKLSRRGSTPHCSPTACGGHNSVGSPMPSPLDRPTHRLSAVDRSASRVSVTSTPECRC
jgi:DNA-binding HxlR family transcriptional regulator